MKPENLRFAKTHEWAAIETASDGSKIAVVGISAFAVEALTDLVFIDLPQIGRVLAAGESFGEIESVKAVSDLYSPVSGTILAVNTALADALETLSTDPYGAGWMIKLKLSDESEVARLMDYAAYQRQCAEEGH